MKKLILLAASTAVISAPAFAAPGNTDTATGAATAEVVAPITLTHTTDRVLDFGSFSAGTATGTVVVSRNGNGSSTGDVTLLSGSVEASDNFTVEGDPDRRFSITTGAGTVTGAGDPMAFTTDARGNQTLDASGDANFNVGGTLSVGADQAAGTYTGDYTVTVTYN